MQAGNQTDKNSEAALFAQYVQTGDPALREQLIIRYIGRQR